MKSCRIPFIENKDLDNISYRDIKAIKISNWPWMKDYTPKCSVKAFVSGCCSKGEKLHIRMTCYEKNPKAVYTNFFDDVYKDSCLEAFISFTHGGPYMNCEMNANGASLIAFGPDRENRTRIDALIIPPSVRAEIKKKKWRVEIVLDISDLRKIFGEDTNIDKGSEFFANFYKCGDETEIVHYGCWSPIETPEPDFHRPEYFGRVTIG